MGPRRKQTKKEIEVDEDEVEENDYSSPRSIRGSRRKQTKKEVEIEVDDDDDEVEEEEVEDNNDDVRRPPRLFSGSFAITIVMLFIIIVSSLWHFSPATVLLINSYRQGHTQLSGKATDKIALAAMVPTLEQKKAEAEEAARQEAIRVAEVLKQKEMSAEQQKFKEQEDQLAFSRARRVELEKEVAIEISMTKKKEEAVARARSRRQQMEQEERTLTEEAAIAMRTKEKALQLKLKNEAELAALQALEKQKAQELVLMKRQEEQTRLRATAKAAALARAERLRQQRKEDEARALLEEQERIRNSSIVVRMISTVVPQQYQPSIKQSWHDFVDYSNKRCLAPWLMAWRTHIDPLISRTPLPKVFRVIDVVVQDKVFSLFPAPYRSYESIGGILCGLLLVMVLPLLFCGDLLGFIRRLTKGEEHHNISNASVGTALPSSPNKANGSDRQGERSSVGMVSPTSSEGSIDADPEVTPMKPALIKRLEEQLRASTALAEELLTDKHAMEDQLGDLSVRLKVSREEAAQLQADVEMATSGNVTCYMHLPPTYTLAHLPSPTRHPPTPYSRSSLSFPLFSKYHSLTDVPTQ